MLPRESYDIDAYALAASVFAVYPAANTGSNAELAYLALGLAGESGEVAEKIKKKLRDGKFNSQELAKELGDVFWYLSQLCLAISYDPSEILEENLKKLASRRDRGVIQGEGDNR